MLLYLVDTIDGSAVLRNSILKLFYRQEPAL